MKRKWLAIGIILLFVGMAFSPVINASKIDGLLRIKRNPEERLVRVHCYEFKYDGNVEKTTILLPRSEHIQMRQALSMTTSIEEKLEVYKKYGVLPSDTSIQKIKENYNQYLITKKINISAIQEYTSNHKTIWPSGIMMNNNCKIGALVGLGININFGMSAWTQWWNGIASLFYQPPDIDIWLFLPGIDLSCFSFCYRTFGWTSNGTLPDTSWDFGYVATMVLLGFIGYYIEDIPLPIALIMGQYIGYTISVMATGVPIDEV